MSDTNDFIKKGDMIKRGHGYPHHWQCRTFVLTATKLDYYVDKTLRGTCAITATSKVEAVAASKPNAFCLSDTEKAGDRHTLLVCCEAPEIMNEWIDAVQKVIGALKEPNVTASGNKEGATPTDSSSTAEKPVVEEREPLAVEPFFMNVYLVNKDKAIKTKVSEATGGGFMGYFASSAAVEVISDESVSTKLADTLAVKIPATMADMGIEAEFKVRFQHKSYVVLMVTIKEVDILPMILAGKGPEFAGTFSTLISCVQKLEVPGAMANIHDKMMVNVRSKLMEKFGEMIPQKMAEAGVICEIVTKSPQEQAMFFFEMLDRIN